MLSILSQSARHAPIMRLVLAGMGLAVLTGCIGTAKSIVTAPVKVAGQSVDWMTTSQSEADEKRGRDLRKREEKLAKLQREYDRTMRRCEQGNEDACDDARVQYAEIQDLSARVPAR